MNSNSPKAPVLFISHGAPTFALEPGVLGARLNALGQQVRDTEVNIVRGVRSLGVGFDEVVLDEDPRLLGDPGEAPGGPQ